MDRKETELSPPEPIESEAVPASADVPRKASELLVQGEELFSQGLYQRAIHVWTRILFLDRGNPEARLAIDKAKRLIAERQRRLDAEAAQAGRLLEAGDVSGARRQVRAVLEVDASHGEAVQLEAKLSSLERLERLERMPETTPEPSAEREIEAPPVSEPASRGVVVRVPKGRSTRGATSRRSRIRASHLGMTAFFLGALLLFAASALYLHQNWEWIVGDGAFGQSPNVLDSRGPEPLGALVPDLAELHYYNGARLFADGRYREALAELSRIERSSSVNDEARRLILRIEERLLRGASSAGAEIPAAPLASGVLP